MSAKLLFFTLHLSDHQFLTLKEQQRDQLTAVTLLKISFRSVSSILWIPDLLFKKVDLTSEDQN